MSDRQGGSYGLRKAAAPKKFDTDFEYYYTKNKITSDSSSPSGDLKRERVASSSKDVNTSGESIDSPHASPKRRYELQLSEGEDTGITDSPSKRSRGRPRKYQVLDEPILIPDESDTNVDYVHLKSKREKRHVKEERVEESSVEAVIESLEQNIGQELMVIPQVETQVIVGIDPDDPDKHIRIEHLHHVQEMMEVEQAIIPHHEEKENQPHIEIHQGEHIPEEGTEEILMLGMGSDDEGNITDLTEVRVEVGTDGIEVPIRKPRRKYRKIKATPETLRHLKEFGADDKIECNECHKLLKPSSFRQHLKTHTGIKPFGCEVCDARFTRKGDVERHIRIVHNKQKPFNCHRCPRSFGDKKNLRWHLMNHDKKLFYVCETCGFKFGKKEYYENHVRFIHPMPEDENFTEEECPALVDSLLTTSMEEGECSTSGFSYIPAGFVIKKGGNTISVLDPGESEDFDGETLEITETQLHQLLQQNTYGKRVQVIDPKNVKWATPKKIIQNEPKNSQVVSFKDLEKITNLSSEQLAKLHMTTKDIDGDGIEAVVIQIEQSSDHDDPENEILHHPEEVLIPDEGSQTVIVEEEEEEDDILVEKEEEGQHCVPETSHDEGVNIVVSKSSSQENSEADANVQSLIDALLDAAKDSSQNLGTSTS